VGSVIQVTNARTAHRGNFIHDSETPGGRPGGAAIKQGDSAILLAALCGQHGKLRWKLECSVLGLKHLNEAHGEKRVFGLNA
jgi:hypothetical protein